jgi:hypothetical protein
MAYVSITGLRLKSAFHTPRFMWHAIRSMSQAQGAPGNILADARLIEGVHHTLSVWQDKTAMRTYLSSGPHRAAMKAFHGIATGSTYGYDADSVPDWHQAHLLWRENARKVEPSATA